MVEEIDLIFRGSYISRTKLFNIIGPHCQHIPKSQKIFLKLSCTLVQALTLREAPSLGEAGYSFRWIRTSRAIHSIEFDRILIKNLVNSEILKHFVFTASD